MPARVVSSKSLSIAQGRALVRVFAWGDADGLEGFGLNEFLQDALTLQPVASTPSVRIEASTLNPSDWGEAIPARTSPVELSLEGGLREGLVLAQGGATGRAAGQLSGRSRALTGYIGRRDMTNVRPWLRQEEHRVDRPSRGLALLKAGAGRVCEGMKAWTFVVRGGQRFALMVAKE